MAPTKPDPQLGIRLEGEHFRLREIAGFQKEIVHSQP
jgi:hypothetical protein